MSIDGWFRRRAPHVPAAGLALAVLLLLAALSGLARVPAAAAASAAPAFAGSAACAGCHAAETRAWRGSHHDLAMAEATEQSVLGDFSGASFSHQGVTSRFFKKDGRFFVHTDGPDGKPADFEIRYTFGVMPLQQYLIAFPDGRIQALGIAWDARPKEKGGQRWFHLYPDRTLKAGDPLHWTGIDQTWNFQCAECHSTGLRKKYDAANNSYATTWAEIDVACESCHGPGSAHVAWAEGGRSGANGLTVHFDERDGVHWTPDPSTGTARRSTPRTSAKELETCGVCHSRSAKIAGPWQPGRALLESHVPSLLEPGLFEADGNSLDEVFTYAPFRQSKMFVAGVSCSDCHDPHSLELRAEGDGVCLQCHDGARFAARSHHHHREGTAGARCVACHMPVKTYMIVDPRHDHGFRIPRPDESVRFGTSNACTDCHRDRDAEWAASAVARWYGRDRTGFQTWTETFAAARAGRPEAAALLLRLAGRDDTPSIVRATAYQSLAVRPSPQAVAAARRGLADADPLVRLGALRALRPYPAHSVWPHASHLLADPVLAVRIEAASLLADAPQGQGSADDRARLARAIDEYVTAQRVNADRPEHRVNLGGLYLRLGRHAEAEAELQAARRLDASFIPAEITLAELHARTGRDAGGERALRAALTRHPDSAALHHALGLNLVRQRRPAEALSELGRAAALDPASARIHFVYAVALNAAGRTDEALDTLEASAGRHPADRDTLLALATINRDAGRSEAARRWAERLAAIDPSARPLVDHLRQPSPPP
jgi:predicted CXXCH cytochrome family protein